MLRQTSPVLAVFFLLFIGVVVASPACSSPNKRTKVLQQTLVAVRAAKDGFLAWDRAHLLKIADTASSREDAIAKANEYFTRQRKVLDSFEVVYKALAVAATQTDELSLQAALAAAGDLLTSIKKLMGGG